MTNQLTPFQIYLARTGERLEYFSTGAFFVKCLPAMEDDDLQKYLLQVNILFSQAVPRLERANLATVNPVGKTAIRSALCQELPATPDTPSYRETLQADLLECGISLQSCLHVQATSQTREALHALHRGIDHAENTVHSDLNNTVFLQTCELLEHALRWLATEELNRGGMLPARRSVYFAASFEMGWDHWPSNYLGILESLLAVDDAELPRIAERASMLALKAYVSFHDQFFQK